MSKVPRAFKEKKVTKANRVSKVSRVSKAFKEKKATKVNRVSKVKREKPVLTDVE